MTKLISLTLANGTTHTCDESCYNSTETECTCICLGLNHGVGLRHAQRNVMVETPKILQHVADHYPIFNELLIHLRILTLQINPRQPKTNATRRKPNEYADRSHPTQRNDSHVR